MSGTPRAGRNGVVMIDRSAGGAAAATPLLAKQKWSVSNTAATFDTTGFGDANKTKGTELPDASCQIDGLWDAGDSSWKNLIGLTVGRKMYIYPDLTNNPTDYFFGTFVFSVDSDGATTGGVNQKIQADASAFAGWN